MQPTHTPSQAHRTTMSAVRRASRPWYAVKEGWTLIALRYCATASVTIAALSNCSARTSSASGWPGHNRSAWYSHTQPQPAQPHNHTQPHSAATAYSHKQSTKQRHHAASRWVRGERSAKHASSATHRVQEPCRSVDVFVVQGSSCCSHPAVWQLLARPQQVVCNAGGDGAVIHADATDERHRLAPNDTTTYR